jgi:hypothetical protein
MSPQLFYFFLSRVLNFTFKHAQFLQSMTKLSFQSIYLISHCCNFNNYKKFIYNNKYISEHFETLPNLDLNEFSEVRLSI